MDSIKVEDKSNSSLWLYIGLILTAVGMRAPISAVGPLVSQIKFALNLSSVTIGLLTTIPLLVFSIVAIPAARFVNLFSKTNQLRIYLALVFVGILLRSYGLVFGLISGTILLGLGIGLLNILIPAFIKTNFNKKIGLATGLYTTSMTALSAAASGMSVLLSIKLSGWSNSLAVVGILPFLAILFWFAYPSTTIDSVKTTVLVDFKMIVASPSNWFIAIFMGIQGFLFFSAIAWLPSMLIENGLTVEMAARSMLWLQFISLVTTFGTPILMQRLSGKKKILSAVLALFYAGGLALVAFSSQQGWLISGALLIGLGSGMCLSYALVLMTVAGKSPQETAYISSFAQSIGYLVASLGPFAVGYLYDEFGSFQIATMALILACIPMGLTAWQAAGKSKFLGVE